MRLLIFFADEFICTPSMKTLEEFPEVNHPLKISNAVLGFIHVEPKDLENQNKIILQFLK